MYLTTHYPCHTNHAWTFFLNLSDNLMYCCFLCPFAHDGCANSNKHCLQCSMQHLCFFPEVICDVLTKNRSHKQWRLMTCVIFSVNEHWIAEHGSGVQILSFHTKQQPCGRNIKCCWKPYPIEHFNEALPHNPSKTRLLFYTFKDFVKCLPLPIPCHTDDISICVNPGVIPTNTTRASRFVHSNGA